MFMARQRKGKWMGRFRIVKFAIFLIAATIVITNNLTPPTELKIPESVQNIASEVVMEREAIASLGSLEPKKPVESLMQKHRDRAIWWFYKKTDKIPQTIAGEYVDFISTNIEPKLQPLVLALVTVESGGDAFALSPMGACGITQIVPKYWEKKLISEGLIKEARDLFDYRKNLLSHQYILKTLIDKNGENMSRVLVAYSGYNTKYADKVLGRANDLKAAMVGQPTEGSSPFRKKRK